ncbi:MAG: GNAT family protein [Planctomycetota bacterium]
MTDSARHEPTLLDPVDTFSPLTRPSMRPSRPVQVPAPDQVLPEPGRASIRTPRMLLRPLREADRDAWIAAYDRSRSHLADFLPLGSDAATTPAIFDRQLELTSQGDDTGRAFRRIAVDLGTGDLLGAFNLVTIRRGLEFEADFSLWLTADALGRGLAREGLTALASYSFADLPDGLGLVKLVGWICPDNQRSQRLVTDCGFDRDGNESTHLSTGDRWKLHERWEARVDPWLAVHG